MATITKITLPNNSIYDLRASSIPYGECDSTSTSTAYTATVPGITALSDGVLVLLKNGVVTSASGFTININGLGAKPVYSNMATGNSITPTNPTRDTTIFNINYTMLLIYSSTIVDGGGWICYRGYDANTNTIGYQLRTNSTVRNVSDTARYYKLYFTSADDTMWVPASVNSTNNATSERPVNQRPIDPFGPIVYTSANTNYTEGSNLAATTIWQQYVLSLGYSFNRTGAALTLTGEGPVYVKCTPQTDGSAIMDADTPIVQSLPSTKDGKIYIYLGIATSTTQIELQVAHPVYYHDGTGIRLWTGAAYQEKLVSGTNIKTVNGTSLLGSGDLEVGGSVEALTNAEIEAAVDNAYEQQISYLEPYKTNGDIKGLSTDGTRVVGQYANSAEEGDTLTILTSGSWDAVVTNDTTGDRVACTYVEFDTSSEVWAKVWTCIMPDSNVTITADYND